MNRDFQRASMSPSQVMILLVCGLVATPLLVAHPTDYPDLHTGLDIGMFLMSGVLALLFWDQGAHLGRNFPRLIALAFTFTNLMEVLHAFVGVDWSGFLVPIRSAAQTLRPATWPPSAHVLPIALAAAWRGGRVKEKTCFGVLPAC